MHVHGNEGIHVLDAFLGREKLGTPHVLRSMNDLALEIRDIDGVEIDESQMPDSGRGEIEGDRRTQATRSHDEHPGIAKTFLTLETHLGQGQMTGVAFELPRGELAHASSPRMAIDANRPFSPSIHAPIRHAPLDLTDMMR